MRVVIPYRWTSNSDLEYAVKSIILNYEPLQQIIIVGDTPKFAFDGQVIPCPDPHHKERNIYEKLKRVKGEYLFTNDDIFFLRKINAVPDYYKGYCSEYGRQSPYYKKLYAACPEGWLDFDVHCPMVIDSDRLQWLGDMPLKSQYGNSVGLKGVFTEDFKIRTLQDVNLDRDFMSIHTGISKVITPLLKRLFD